MSSHLCLGLPLDLVVRGVQLNIFLTVLDSGNLCIWPKQLSLRALMWLIIFWCFISLSNSSLVWFSITGFLLWVQISSVRFSFQVLTVSGLRTFQYPCLRGKGYYWSYYNGISTEYSVTRNSDIILTFKTLAVSLRTTRFKVQKCYMVLTLRWVFCTDLRTDSELCFIRQ
jgi:hypothetical protein